MLRKLAPSFVVTFAALAPTGCHGTEPTPDPTPTAMTHTNNPPALVALRKRRRTTDAGRQYGASTRAPIDYASLVTLNPEAAGRGTIYAGAGDTCYTTAPEPNPPANRPTGMPPLIVTPVDCPTAMDDPAWDTCDARLARVGATGECYCIPTSGNPPPPPSPNACPKR